MNFMNGAGRFPRHGIIYPAGKNWQEPEPHLKGQSANSLLPAPSAPTPASSPTRPAAPGPGRPPAPLPVSGGAGGGAGGEVLEWVWVAVSLRWGVCPLLASSRLLPLGADDTRTSLSCVAPQLSANTELPGAVLILSERMHSL